MSILWSLLILLPVPAAHESVDMAITRWVTAEPDSALADSSALEDEAFESEAAIDSADATHAEDSVVTSPDSASMSFESDSETAAPVLPNSWGVTATMTTYFGTSRDPYAVPVLGIEYQGLYMEARYNYEDFETGSIFLGWHFEVGDEYLGADITPLFGAVFGQSDGVAPGLLFEMNLDQWVLQSELEYVVLSEVSSESFVYNHSELSYRMKSGLYFGLVGEHSKTLGSSDRDFVPGFLAGMEGGRLSAAFYLLYSGEDEATGAFELAFDF